MKQYPFLICLVFLLLLFQVGITSADSPANTTTTTVTTAAGTTPSGRTGGSIFFDTHPPAAKVWLDNVEIGTSPFTYYSEKTGTFDVRVQRKGYEEYTDKVTVSEGKRVVVDVLLKPVSRDIPESTPATPVATATTIRKSTMNIPTPWPTSPESPVDPAVVIGAVAAGAGFFVIRRR
jgi:hypothetical protein